MKQRIVIYRLGSLGDTIVALPCFNLIARAFPDAERIVLTNIPVSSKAAPLETILGNSGLIHGAISYPQSLRSPAEILRLRQRLRELKASALVYLAPSRGLLQIYRDVAFFASCGVGRIIGAPWTPDLANNRYDAATGMEERECARLARTLSGLGSIDLEDPAGWDLHLTDNERLCAQTALAPLDGKPFIAINMGGKVAINDWSAERWDELLRLLADLHYKFGLVVVGGSEDSARAARAMACWKGPALDLCGRLSPRECAAALAGASLFIGHDSGPMHLAACMGVPCIGIFSGNNRPGKWYPYGQQHVVLQDATDIRRIQPSAVAEKIFQRLR